MTSDPPPDGSKDVVPGVSTLMRHIDDLHDNKVDSFDERLFDRIALHVTDDNRPALSDIILVELVVVIRQAFEKQQDPSPAVPLAVKLLKDTTFDEVLAICNGIELEWALTWNSIPGIQMLTLEIVHKASRTPEDCVKFARMEELCGGTIFTMFHAKDVGVGQKVVQVLTDVLEMDWPNKPSEWNAPQGKGAVWSSVWESARMTDVWHMSLGSTPNEKNVPYHELTVAQARTLDLVARCASMEPMRMLLHPAFDFFTCDMVNQDDFLMCMTLGQFWEKTISLMRISHRRNREVDEELSKRLKRSIDKYPVIYDQVRGLPDRTVEEESEPLREYLAVLL